MLLSQPCDFASSTTGQALGCIGPQALLPSYAAAMFVCFCDSVFHLTSISLYISQFRTNILLRNYILKKNYNL
jgi:hypothetical protein